MNGYPTGRYLGEPLPRKSPALIESEWKRIAYVLAMEILQSDLYQNADEEVKEAIRTATRRE